MWRAMKRAKLNPPQLKDACSVTEMAMLLGISRQRLYQLQNSGVFPYPVYCIYTKRPFYTKALQMLCLEIKRSGIGLNGRPTLFYQPRKSSPSKDKSPKDQRINEITEILKHLGMNADYDSVQDAIKKMHPKGLPPEYDDSLLIRDLLRHFYRTK